MQNMKTELINADGTNIAEIISEETLILNTQDALDLMADCSYQGAGKIILHQKNFVPACFDLKTGIAGDILQKFSNYRVQLAIVGDFAEVKSKSLRDFIRESNRQGRIFFVDSVQEARERLKK